MAFHSGAIEATLADALGDDAALIAELRDAFFASASGYRAAIEAAPDQARIPSQRLYGLAASFGAERLMRVLEPVVARGTANDDDLRRIKRALSALKAD